MNFYNGFFIGIGKTISLNWIPSVNYCHTSWASAANLPKTPPSNPAPMIRIFIT